MDENIFHNLPLESAEELYENAPCGYISFLADGTIFRINNTLLHLLGYEVKDEIVHVKKIQDLFRIGGKIYFETHFFPLVKIQGFVKEVNFDLVGKDGNFFPALINVNQIPATETHPVTYRASVIDITHRKKYEMALLEGKEKAEEATRAKADFLSTISHEIRTPLYAIVGIGNLIQNTPLDKLQKEYARILQFSSSNLLELVNNLLDLSKLEASKVKLEKKDFSLFELLEGMMHTFKLRANEKKIKLKKDFPIDLPDHLLGDPIKLNQILTNLLGNAIKFTREGYVKLRIEETQRSDKSISLKFSVSDTGIGIPEDKLKIIFREFSQASYDVNLEFGGTGLGLTISQKLLQMHGSELEVKSEEGKGSEFSFALDFKLSKERLPLQKKNARLMEDLSATGANVLVVDDNPVNLFITSEYLQNWGLRSQTVESGEGALKVVKEKKFDIILMDLHMPKMSGYEAAKAIRDLQQDPQPAIIALSASGRGDINLKMERAGINAYVPKPFNPTELQEVMLQLLKGNNHKSGTEEIFIPARDQTIYQSSLLPLGVPSVNFEKLSQLAKGDQVIFGKLIKNSLQSIKLLKKEFIENAFNENGENLSELMHKNTMTLHYLQGQRISMLLENLREAHRIENSENDLQRLRSLIIEELDEIAATLENEVAE